MVRELLLLEGDQRIDVHAWAESAFEEACQNGHMEIARVLLSLDGDRYINVHADREAAFRGACQRGCTDTAQLLLSLGGDRRIDVHASNGMDAFHLACRFGHACIVELLLSLDGDRRIDVHAEQSAAFQTACRWGNTEVVEVLLSLDDDRRINIPSYGEKVFQDACNRGCEGVVRLLLALDGDRRIDVHAGNEGGFRIACQHEHMTVIEMLLALPPERGYTWDTPAQQALLVNCIQWDLTDRTSAARLLLQRAALPPSCLQQMAARQKLHVALPDLGPRGVAVVQQVLLVQCRLHPTSPYRLSRKLRMIKYFPGKKAVTDVLALCCLLLLPAHRAALALAVSTFRAGKAEDVDDFLRGLVWRGAWIPLVDAPGVHLLEGGLQRVGRRRLLLHRAAARRAAKF